MTSYQRMKKNIEFCNTLLNGDKFLLTDFSQSGRRVARVHEFVRRAGNELDCVEVDGTPHTFSLMFVACREYRSKKKKKQLAVAG